MTFSAAMSSAISTSRTSISARISSGGRRSSTGVGLGRALRAIRRGLLRAWQPNHFLSRTHGSRLWVPWLGSPIRESPRFQNQVTLSKIHQVHHLGRKLWWCIETLKIPLGSDSSLITVDLHRGKNFNSSGGELLRNVDYTRRGSPTGLIRPTDLNALRPILRPLTKPTKSDDLRPCWSFYVL